MFAKHGQYEYLLTIWSVSVILTILMNNLLISDFYIY